MVMPLSLLSHTEIGCTSTLLANWQARARTSFSPTHWQPDTRFRCICTRITCNNGERERKRKRRNMPPSPPPRTYYMHTARTETRISTYMEHTYTRADTSLSSAHSDRINERKKQDFSFSLATALCNFVELLVSVLWRKIMPFSFLLSAL